MKRLPALFRKAIPAIALPLIYLSSYSQNLIVNPGAEDPVASPWVVVNAISACAGGTQWRMESSQAGYPPAQDGTYFFQAGCVGSATNLSYELRQDIDVSANSTAIDANAFTASFSGYMQSFSQTPADQTAMIVEYRDAANTSVLDFYTTNTQAVVSVWTQYTNTRAVPVGTRFIRIRLIGTSRNGNAVDAYFDNLSLTVASTLPVTWTFFNAVGTGDQVTLSWKTATETNNKGFTIEQSIDGQKWNAAGFVASKAQNGSGGEYTFTDQGAFHGLNYYRLRQEDIDGRHTFSDIKKVQLSGTGASSIFPNPVRGVLNLTTGMTNPQIRIINMEGKVVYTKSGYQRQISTAHLSPGFYYLILQDGKKEERLKFMKQ